MRFAGGQAADFGKGNHVHDDAGCQKPEVTLYSLNNPDAKDEANQYIHNYRGKKFHAMIVRADRGRRKFFSVNSG